MRIVGINLATFDNHATGVSELEEGKIRTFSVYKDPDIIEIVDRFKPEVVVFDTPITLSTEPYRCAEKEMLSMGYEPEPQNMENNKHRIKRAINLKKNMDEHIKVIETHLPSVKKALNLDDPKKLQNVRVMNIMKNQFEKDSVFAAVTGLFYLDNLYHQFGDEEEGHVILPKLD
jgi:predicted nuclease with RNAse H fold